MKPVPANRSLHILLLAAIFALAGQLAVATLLDAAPVGVRFPRAQAIVDLARSMDPPPEVVLFGSSRLDAAVDVTRLDRLLADPDTPRPVVLGATVMGGEGYSFAFLERQLREAGVREGTAVVEILPETVSDKVRFLDGALVRHFSWADVAAALPDIRRSGLLGVLAETRLNTVFFYRTELLQWLGSALPAPPAAAPAAVPAAAADPAPRPRRTELRRLRIELGKVRKNLLGYRIGGGAQRALERTVAALDAQGTHVLLVAPPVMTAHRALYEPEVEAAFQAYVASLRRRFGTGFLDWRAALPDEAMFDNHHANEVGRRRFTALLAEGLRADADARADTAAAAAPSCPGPAGRRADEVGPRPGDAPSTRAGDRPA